MTATDTPETNVSSTICRRSSRDRYCRTGFAGRLACSISLIHTLSGERPQPNPSERMHLTQTHTPDGLMSTLTANPHARRPYVHAYDPQTPQRGNTVYAEKPTPKSGLFINYAGDHLISHTLTRAVPSAQRGLTSVFGMGTGGTLVVNSPAISRKMRRSAIVHN